MPALLRIAAAAALLAAACVESANTVPPPEDRFFFPTGLAVHRTAADETALIVASSNFDLRYSPDDGGTLLSVRPESVGAPGDGLARLGVARMPSFAGTIAVADETSCPGIGGAVALVASRHENALVRAGIDAGGALACGPGCMAPLDAGVEDPFGVVVACRGTRRRAYLGYLSPVRTGGGVMTEIDLATGDLLHHTGTNARGDRAGLLAPPYDLAYDAARDRLWVTEQAVLAAPLQAVELSMECEPGQPGCYLQRDYDLWPLLRGADLHGIALSNPQVGMGRRAYVAARVYDADLALTIGGHPGFDVASYLLVLDLEDGSGGAPPNPPPLVRMVPLGLGASQVRVLPARAGQRDLVVVTSTTEETLTLYDDELGAVAKVFALAQAQAGPDNPAGVPVGTPLVGKQPFGLAVESRAGGRDWIYVGAFRSDTVTAVSLDPADPSGAVVEWARREVQP